MNSDFVNWISIVGSLASLIGLGIAYWQIYKTRKAAEAAEKAATQTRAAITKNFLISDISTCVRYIEEIRLYLRNESYDLTQIRLNDLISQIIQIQSLVKSFDRIQKINFEEIISELVKTRNSLRKKIAGSPLKFNFVRTNNQLDIISDSLNKVIGEIKISVEKGDWYE